MLKNHNLVVDTFLSKKAIISSRRVCIAGFGDDNLQTYLGFKLLEIFLRNYSFVKVFENKDDFPCMRFGVKEYLKKRIDFFSFSDVKNSLSLKEVFILNYYEQDYTDLMNLINLNMVEKYIFIIGRKTKDFLRAKEIISRIMQNTDSYIGIFFSRVTKKNFPLKIFKVFSSLHSDTQTRLLFLGNICPDFNTIKQVLLGLSKAPPSIPQEDGVSSLLVDYLMK